MASPTAIPHAEASCHHQHPPSSSPPRATIGLGVGAISATTATSNRNSPPLLSPIYARTAFSLPGAPVSPSNSFRNTASGAWTNAGVNVGSVAGGGGGGPMKSPVAIASQQTAQKDNFPEREYFTTHHRTSSFSAASSVDSNGPTTPRSGEPTTAYLAGGAPLGRVRSIPLPSSYDAIKRQKEGWNGSQGWAGLSSFRAQGNAVAHGGSGVNSTSPPPATGGGGMGSLFRRLSLSNSSASQNVHRPDHGHAPGHVHRSTSLSYAGSIATGARSISPTEASNAAIKEKTEATGVGTGAAPAAPAVAASASPPMGQSNARGRRADTGSSIKRKPSPHGERLLMGWTHAH